jgi:hypothetical protein
MGELLERVKLSKLVYGNGEAENYKNNSLFFFNSYSQSSKFITAVARGQINLGGFYFFHYLDDSNWMKYSPVFTVSFKKFNNIIVILAVNLNFIPLEVRVTIFDKFIKAQDFESDSLLPVTYEGVYKELIKWGFEYAIVEYNVSQIQIAHKISLSQLPRFLNAGHPINIYDPKKLYSIWTAKFDEHFKRHQEMSKLMISDLYDVEKDISEEYDLLKDHIDRIKTSFEKYGK